MGNFCNKLYYSIPQRQKCPYCPKSPYISEKETAFKIREFEEDNQKE